MAEKSTILSVRLRPEQKAKLWNVARSKNKTLSGLVREVVRREVEAESKKGKAGG